MSKPAARAIAAAALAVAAGAPLDHSEIVFADPGGRVLTAVQLDFAGTFDRWPLYIAGGLVVAVLMLAKRSLLALAVAWLWFAVVGLDVVSLGPHGASAAAPSADGCFGLPPDPGGYWGDAAWSHIEPAYDRAAREVGAADICWYREDGPAAAVILITSFAGLVATAVAASWLRTGGRLRRTLLAAAIALPPALLWLVVALVEGLGHLE